MHFPALLDIYSVLTKTKHALARVRVPLIYTALLKHLYYAAEAHEGHCEESGSEQRNRCTLHRFRYSRQGELFAQTGEEDEREAETKSGSKRKERTGQHTVLCADRQLLRAVGHENSHTENTAVGGDKRQEDTQRLVEGRTDFLEHNLNHLHECSDDEDEEDGLQELQAPFDEQHLQQVRHYGREREHEDNRGTHAQCSVDFLTYSQERTYSEELAQNDIIDEYRRDKYQKIYHNSLPFTFLLFTFQLVDCRHEVCQADEGTRGEDEDERSEMIAEDSETFKSLSAEYFSGT